MGSVPTSLGEWIHSPWFDLGLMVWKGNRPRVRLVLAGAMLLRGSFFFAWPCTGSPKAPSGTALIFFFLEYGRCRTVARSLHEHKQ